MKAAFYYPSSSVHVLVPEVQVFNNFVQFVSFVKDGQYPVDIPFILEVSGTEAFFQLRTFCSVMPSDKTPKRIYILGERHCSKFVTKRYKNVIAVVSCFSDVVL